MNSLVKRIANFLPEFVKNKILNPIKEDVLIDFNDVDNLAAAAKSTNKANVELSFEDNFVDYDHTKEFI